MTSYWFDVRFATKVDDGPGCWNWKGAIYKTTGYGAYRHAGKTTLAHRVSVEMARGPITAGLEVDHLCKNRRCVNPAHLEVVTPHENRHRAAWRTICMRGHPLETRSSGQRICLACKRLRWHGQLPPITRKSTGEVC